MIVTLQGMACAGKRGSRCQNAWLHQFHVYKCGALAVEHKRMWGLGSSLHTNVGISEFTSHKWGGWCAGYVLTYASGLPPLPLLFSSNVGLYSSPVEMWGFTVRTLECGVLEFDCVEIWGFRFSGRFLTLESWSIFRILYAPRDNLSCKGNPSLRLNPCLRG